MGVPVMVWASFDNIERAVLVAGSIASAGVCLWIGGLLGVPQEPHFNGSLLAGGEAVPGLIVAALSIAASIIIGVVVGCLLEVEAGLLTCCMGLATLGVRCGPIRPVLQYSHGASVLVTLAIEDALLAAMLVGGWFALRRIARRMQPAQRLQQSAPNEQTDATLQQKIMTIGVQVVGMALCEQIFIQTDYQAQAMAGVMISGFAGSLVAYMYRPLSEGIWYWTGPAVLGVIGYLLAYFFCDGVAIGDLHGWAGPLARETPLIYISMGTAGALLGYWCSRRWAQPESDEDEVAAAVNS